MSFPSFLKNTSFHRPVYKNVFIIFFLKMFLPFKFLFIFITTTIPPIPILYIYITFDYSSFIFKKYQIIF